MARDLQFRLTLTYLGVTFLGMTLIAVIFAALLANRMTTAHESDLRREAHTLAHQLNSALAANVSPWRIQRIIWRDSELLGKRIMLLDSKGHVRYDSAQWTPFARGAWRLTDVTAVQRGRSTSIEGGGRLGFEQSLTVHGETVGAVALVIKPADGAINWRPLLPSLLTLLGVLAFLWLGLGAYFARTISRPLRMVANALRDAQGGRYDRPIPEEGWSEARVLAAQYNRMVAKVARSQQMQRDFMVNAAHELKTPIALVSGFARSLTDGTAARGGAVDDALGYIREEGEHLARIVDELFALASLDADPEGLVTNPCRPDVLLHQTIDRFRARAGTEKKTVLCVLEPNLPVCRWDVARISSALSNLVGNALDHTGKGDTITLRAHRRDNTIAIDVEDSGCGIPPEELSHVFERFYRGRERRRRDGHAGLGLALVHEIACRHGGTATVRSTPGHGACFTLVLPCNAPSPEELLPTEALA